MNTFLADPPLLPFTRPSIHEADIQAVTDVLRSGWLTTGPRAAAFETALGEFFGGRPVRCFSSGTATLEVALRIADVGPGDEVITTPLSWVATANVILTVGARPVFVDIDPHTRNLCCTAIEQAITPRTKALMPVHLAGLPCDLDTVYGLAQRHGLRVIEDAAQAIDARWQGQRIGSFGDLTSFSFHANKNLCTAEGGCLVFADETQAELATRYRLQGLRRFGTDGMDVDVLGGKFNMTDIAAALGLSQLARIGAFTERRRVLARHYFDCFATTDLAAQGVELPVDNSAQSNWHMFQIVLPETVERAAVMDALKARHIMTGVHYPAIHLFSLYRGLGFAAGQFPVAERIGRRILTLPLFPDMTIGDVERVVDALQLVFTTMIRTTS